MPPAIAPAPKPAAELAPAPPEHAAVDAKPTVPSAADAARDAELAKLADGYVRAFTNAQPVFTRDGKRVVFVSTRDGLPQLYISDVGKAAAPATRLVQSTERVDGPTTTQDGKIVFRSDHGGDEQWSLYRVDADGKNLIELTPGEQRQRDQPFASDAGIFYTARKMSEARTSLYSLTSGAEKALFTSELPTELADVDRKGTLAAMIEIAGMSDQHLLGVDIATGKATKLYPTTGAARIFDAQLSADAKRIYVATDGGSEQTEVLALDAKTGKQIARYDVAPATALVRAMTIAKPSGLVALTLFVGSHAELVLLDGKKLTPTKQKIKLPLGDGTAGRFAEDGKHLVATWATPSSPDDIYSIDTATGVSEPLRMEPRPTLAHMPKIEVEVVEIRAFDGGKIPTNVYIPSGGGADASQPHPVVVFYHGGPADIAMIGWSPITAFWLSLGYAVVAPNVRGSTGYGRAFEAADNGRKRLDAFKDIETSARWVAAQPWADKKRLVVLGGSYGGYTVLVALTRWPDIFRAGIDVFGVVNLNTLMQVTSGAIRQVFFEEMGDPDKDRDFLAQISPINMVDKVTAPTFVFAGARDPRVPRSESDQIVKALRARHIFVEYMVAENEGHSLAHAENQTALFARAARFLEAALR